MEYEIECVILPLEIDPVNESVVGPLVAEFIIDCVVPLLVDTVDDCVDKPLVVDSVDDSIIGPLVVKFVID